MLKNKKQFSVIKTLTILTLVLLLNGCNQEAKKINREDKIPVDAIKMSPEKDITPPQLHSNEFTKPVPLKYPANTKGLEDSPFIMPDGKTLYIWFTPNNKMDVIEQSQDKVTGIYKFQKINNEWSEPERVWLEKQGEPHLDGCGFFQNNEVWICGARKGFEGLHWFHSKFKNNKWDIAKIAEIDSIQEIGELHLINNGTEVYFHSSKKGGQGGLDIWHAEKINGKWQEPKNIKNLNTERNEGWPALNPTEDELWISKDYAIWRSKKINGEWQKPEKIISNLASEATIDNNGNVYFTHHYYKDGKMLEADIYIAYRK